MSIWDMSKALRKEKKNEKTYQLFTEWGEKLDPEHVLEEYPRPQLRRQQYTILNGYWRYAFTSAESGCPAEWDGRILVPFSPESVLSGVGRQLQPDEALWYERTFEPEAGERDGESARRTILHFGAVDQSCEVYVNGIKAGSHTGGYLSFSLDITDAVRPGENRLTVRVRDVSDTSWHSRGKQKLKRGGIFYTAQSGIWQTVWMEQVPTHYIRNLWITPRYDEKSVEICVEMNDGRDLFGVKAQQGEIQREKAQQGKTQRGKIQQEETQQGKTRQEETQQDKMQRENTQQGNTESSGRFGAGVCVRAGKKEIFRGSFGDCRFTVPIADMISWTPENPFLYDLTVTVGEDTVESYFAMRTFTRETDERGIPRLCLNHQPCFMHGVLDQGYWPDGLLTAPADEALIHDIKTIKALGFNTLRKHCKLEPMRWYYHCDRLGMIVWQDMPNGGTDYHMGLVGYLPVVLPRARMKDNHYRLFARAEEASRKEWRAESEATVRQLYNCPSIAAWVIFNEGWGQFDAAEGVKLVRGLDGFRLIDQASGWFDQKGGDMRSVHNYLRKQRTEKDKYGRAFVISEYGGYAWHVQGHAFSDKIFGYRHYKDQTSLNTALSGLIGREIMPLIEKGLAGAIYTQVSDVEEEVNGLMTYDRKLVKMKNCK